MANENLLLDEISPSPDDEENGGSTALHEQSEDGDDDNNEETTAEETAAIAEDDDDEQDEDGDAPKALEEWELGGDDEEEEQEDHVGSAKSVVLEDQPKGLPSDKETVSVKQKLEASGSLNAEGKPVKAPRRRWYIIHTYSGHENKVKVNLERRIESMNMADKIFNVEVPQKTVTKIKDGKRSERDERIFPGYVLVEMLMDDDSWYVVRHTPGVTKFVGSQKRPIPAKDSEIKRILLRNQPIATVAKVEIDLKVGEIVKIISGPFADFEGTVTEISPEKERLKASVVIFGRETPVELAFNQVQKSA